MGHVSLSTSHSLTCQINPNQANSSRGFTTLKPKLFCKRARSCKYGVFQIVRESDKGTAVSKTLNVSKASKLLLVPPFFLPHGILHHTAPYGWILHSQLPSAPFRTMAHLQVGAASAGAAFSHLCGHPRVDLTCDHSLAASVSGESCSAWQCVSTLPTCLTILTLLHTWLTWLLLFHLLARVWISPLLV